MKLDAFGLSTCMIIKKQTKGTKEKLFLPSLSVQRKQVLTLKAGV